MLALPDVRDEFVGDELVAVLDDQFARKGLAREDDHVLAVLPEFLDQGEEVGVARDDGKRVDVGVRDRGLHGIDGELDVGPVLAFGVEARFLDEFDTIAEQALAVVPVLDPVRVGFSHTDDPELGERVDDRFDLEFRLVLLLQADLDVLEIDVERDDLGIGCHALN